MSRACSTRGKEEKFDVNVVRKLKGKDRFEDD
jgi:hypothetical protein